MKHKIILLFLLTITQVSHLFAQGCSQCKLMVEQGSEMDESTFGSNINSGILYLMIVPYMILMFLFRHQIISFVKGFFTKAEAVKH
ncbi:MAG: hypothetical protein EBU01_11855 [Crocinitomicaceae bacterium]|nr:hypothetical protein [Crocinitomicaceae bacterium]